MSRLVLRIFDFLRHHRLAGVVSFVVITALLAASVMRLDYKEDIADFLPVDGDRQNALKVYQDIAGANKIFAIFQYNDSTKTDADAMVAAVDSFASMVEAADTTGVLNMVAEVDMEQMTDVASFVYDNIPYFLSDSDYADIERRLAQPGFVKGQLQQDKQMLMFPSGGFMTDNIGRDPLNLFAPVVQRLQPAGGGLKYEMYDGHIFSPDMKRAIVMMDSPYGSSETEHNSQLTAMLRTCADSVEAAHAGIGVHIIGGPVIAVGNASQIKQDSLVSVAIAVLLILALLLFAFRNVRNLLLIALSIGWGGLFALGGLALLHDRVSVIVIGISSVILGIAVNYPLHYIAHLSHTPDRRLALREIVMPLLVGNVTTVGAFLALVPLQSVALRDLGLFSSFILIGTILFVLVYLPHLSRTSKKPMPQNTFLDRLASVAPENKPAFVAVILVLTAVFGYYSLQTQFDANMAHINYMTDEQKADMAYFQRMMTQSGDSQKVYVISSDTTADGALDKSRQLLPALDSLVASRKASGYTDCSRFVTSRAEQQRRLDRWHDFVAKHGDSLRQSLESEMAAEGFAEGSFDEFMAVLDADYRPQPMSFFEPLTKQLFASNLSTDSIARRYSVVNVLTVAAADVEKVESALAVHDCYSFDVAQMNSAIANHLSDDFNYIGFACGFIVFFFLWLSFGSIELALLSFIPMAVSWLWILGIMALFGMQFNIVNIILATFIFGQGDDYTIFMTEGAMYEYAYRRKMLASYKHSIIISALIMFIGIGTLIVARHPALHSLAEVTIAGMFSVVLMAYVFPPLIFRLLVQHRGQFRRRPLSLRPVLSMAWSATVFFVQLATVYIYGLTVLRIVSPERRRRLLHRYVQRLYSFDLRHMPTVKFEVRNPHGETLDRPTMIVCNHQSMLDAAVFMALSRRTVLVSNGNPEANIVVRAVYRWLGNVTLTDDMDRNLALLRKRVEEGYSIVVFPEGQRNDKSSILRFHKGAFAWAEQLGLDIVPVIVHGLNDVLPRNSVAVYRGQITVSIRERIRHADAAWGNSYTERTQLLHHYYQREYARLAAEIGTAGYYRDLVADRYRYKGTELFAEVKKNLRRLDGYDKNVHIQKNGTVIVESTGWGEYALLYALVNKTVKVLAVEADTDRRDVLRYAADGVCPNLTVYASLEEAQAAITHELSKKEIENEGKD